MKNQWYKLHKLFYLALFLGIATPVFAEPSDADSSWEFGGEVYLWGASIDATSATESESDIPFDTLLDNLQTAFMGAFGAQKDKWTVSADLIYMDVKDKLKKDVNRPGGQVVEQRGSVELKAWIVTPTVGYAVHDSDKARVEVFGGLRYLYLDAGLRIVIDDDPKLDKNDSGSNWDAIVGMRADINISSKWYLPVYFDIGTGDSKSTWQGFAGIGYRFSKVEAVLAYRYLDYDFDNNPVFDDMTLKGPFAGIGFRF